MLIYDISRSIPGSPPFDGDPETKIEQICSMGNGDDYNLTAFTMSSHTGTHIDAPYHFDEDGIKIEEIRPAVFYGKCSVISADRILTGVDLEKMLPRLRRRLLIHGNGLGFIESSAAQVIADRGLLLVGIDSASIAPSFDEERTHRILAQNGIPIIENLSLDDVEDGDDYTICAFPIRLDGCEAAPCRAILLEQEKGF